MRCHGCGLTSWIQNEKRNSSISARSLLGSTLSPLFSLSQSAGARHAVSSHLQRGWYLRRPSSPPAPPRKVSFIPTVCACERVCERVREGVSVCAPASSWTFRRFWGGRRLCPEVLPSAATHRAFRTPATVRGGKRTSWQRQLVRVLRMNTSCTRSSASKALSRFTLFQVSGVAACSLTPKRAPGGMQRCIRADGCRVRIN